LTNRYFVDLHEGAQYIAENYPSLRDRQELAGGTALLLYPVREHYIVYEPLGLRFIAIVAVIRQGRDIPAILQKWAAPIRRELIEIRGRIERSEIRIPSRSTSKPRRKK
jgi:plasmid stabilization system protein ParE